MDLESIIGRLQAGGDETVYDDLNSLYSDVSERADSADAKIESLTAELTAANEAISTLKAHNYDLLMEIKGASEPRDGDDDGEIDADGDGEEDDDAGDGPGIDELYADDDDEKDEESK